MSTKKLGVFLIFGFASFVILGSVYSWSVVKGVVEKLLSLSALEGNLPFMIFLISYSLFMPIGGFVQKILGVKNTFLVGAVFVGLGYLLAGTLRSFSGLLLGYGLIAGSGVGLCYNVPLTIIAKEFKNGHGTLSGLILAGFGISPLMSAPLFDYLVRRFGLFEMFRLYSLVVFVVLISTYFVFRKLFGIENKSGSRLEEGVKEKLLLSKKFLILYVLFFFSTTTGLMFIGITTQLGTEIVGLTPKSAALFVSVFALFNAFGRILIGWLLDKLNERVVLTSLYVLLSIALLIGSQMSRGQIPLFVFSISVIWLNFGGWLAIAPYLTRKYFGDKRFAQIYGAMFTAYGIGAVAGNILSGLLKDVWGTYQIAFYPSLVLAIAGLICANLFLIERKPA